MAESDKRKNKRWENRAPVRVSFLNKDDGWDALMLNHCAEGMCFRSSNAFKERVGLLIRVDGRAWNNTGSEIGNELRHMGLGAVKWCKKIDDDSGHYFMTGVKYYQPNY